MNAASDGNLPFADVLSSLSYALDLTSGYALGHSQRTCLIGMRIGRLAGLSTQEQTDLYFSLLLKDAGCSSNAARMYEIFGSDEIANKRMTRVTDWTSLAAVVQYVASVTLPKNSVLGRARRLLQIGVQNKAISHDLSQTRCSRGAQIALALGLRSPAAGCIAALEERWDGTGNPEHLRGEAIPMLARIASLAQTLEVFTKTFDLETAYEAARRRSGKWFDPALVRAALTFRGDDAFWAEVFEDTGEALRRLDCAAVLERASEARIDAVCTAFAQIVDAKSPFTGAHSSRVCDYSLQIAHTMGFDPPRLTTLRRAALLHDIGKLAVSNAILDKPGRLDDDEWQAIKKHPYYTQQILQQISGFERLTEIASAHHERLDGKGYFRGLSAEHLDLDMRIVAVADVFDALSAERPYRGALPLDQVFGIMLKDANIALDGDCIAALRGRHAGQALISAPLSLVA